MSRRWLGWISGAAIVLLATVPWFVSAANGGDDVTFGGGIWAWAWFVVLIGAALATGFLLRAWAIPLLVLCVVVLVPLGVNPEDSDGWTYWALQLTGPMLFVTPAALLGVAARLVRDGTVAIRSRRRRAAGG